MHRYILCYNYFNYLINLFKKRKNKDRFNIPLMLKRCVLLLEKNKKCMLKLFMIIEWSLV